jgi:hypothetical protein
MKEYQYDRASLTIILGNYIDESKRYAREATTPMTKCTHNANVQSGEWFLRLLTTEA